MSLLKYGFLYNAVEIILKRIFSRTAKEGTHLQ